MSLQTLVKPLTFEDEYTVLMVKQIVSEPSSSLPRLKLDIPKTPKTPREKQFCKPSVVDAMKKAYLNAIKARTDLKADLAALWGTKILLIPLLVPVSKLYLYFQESKEDVIIHNSITYIRDLNLIVNEMSKVSPLPRTKRKDILENMNKVLSQMITFGANTISKLFIHEFSEEIPKLFARENYYLNLNLIRAFEFTIMDLLGIPEKHQINVVTPIEWNQDDWETSNLYEPHVYQGYHKQLLDTLNSAFDQKIPASDTMDNSEWPSPKIIGLGYVLNKKLMSTYLFWCANHDKCNQRESTLNQFPKCSQCKWVRYCSDACQKSHWPKHKIFCRKKMDNELKTMLFESRRLIISITGERDEK